MKFLFTLVIILSNVTNKYQENLVTYFIRYTRVLSVHRKQHKCITTSTAKYYLYNLKFALFLICEFDTRDFLNEHVRLTSSMSRYLNK